MERYMKLLPGSRLHKIPKDLPVASLIMCFYAERALYAIVEKGGGTLGKSLLLVGFDLMGIFCAMAAKSAGLSPVKVLVDKENPAAQSIIYALKCELVIKLEKDESYDIVIVNTKQPDIVEQAFNSLNPLGRCVYLTSDAPGHFSLQKVLENNGDYES